MRYFDPTLAISRDGITPPAGPKSEMELIVSRRCYSIWLEDSGRLIVECAMGDWDS